MAPWCNYHLSSIWQCQVDFLEVSDLLASKIVTNNPNQSFYFWITVAGLSNLYREADCSRNFLCVTQEKWCGIWITNINLVKRLLYLLCVLFKSKHTKNLKIWIFCLSEKLYTYSLYLERDFLSAFMNFSLDPEQQEKQPEIYCKGKCLKFISIYTWDKGNLLSEGRTPCYI